MMDARVRGILLRVRSALAELYADRLAGILLIGAHARGDAQPGSDVEVLVLLKGVVDPPIETARTRDIFSSISMEEDKVVSCLFLSDERFRKDDSPVLLNIRKEAQPI